MDEESKHNLEQKLDSLNLEDPSNSDQESKNEIKDQNEQIKLDSIDVQSVLEHLRNVEKEISEEQLNANYEKAMDLKQQGNNMFKTGSNYQEALNLYEEALNVLPSKYLSERSVLYNNKCAAKCHLLNEQNITKPEQHPCLIYLNAAIEISPSYANPYYKRAKIYYKFGEEHLEQSLNDYKKIIELNKSDSKIIEEARSMIIKLEFEINQRNERMKAEMVSKLKELGNFCLKPFGLSTNNFKLENNENGGYSVKFNP